MNSLEALSTLVKAQITVTDMDKLISNLLLSKKIDYLKIDILEVLQ